MELYPVKNSSDLNPHKPQVMEFVPIMYGEKVYSRTLSVVKSKAWVGAEEGTRPFVLVFSTFYFLYIANTIFLFTFIYYERCVKLIC